MDGRLLTVTAGSVTLAGILGIPEGATGLVIFAHGSGSGRLSPRNQWVARQLQAAGLGTLLFDLLTADEEAVDQYTRQHRFDIDLLARRLAGVTDWAAAEEVTKALRVGYFGASTGAAAALKAAATLGDAVGAVVSRGGRPDLAGPDLARVRAPTLLIAGGADTHVIALNQQAFAQLNAVKELAIVPGASHLFEEPGALEQVARLAAAWFGRWLGAG